MPTVCPLAVALPSIGKFVAGNVRILLAWPSLRSLRSPCSVPAPWLWRTLPCSGVLKRNQFPFQNWSGPLPWAQVSSCCTNKYFAPDVWVTIACRCAPVSCHGLGCLLQFKVLLLHVNNNCSSRKSNRICIPPLIFNLTT